MNLGDNMKKLIILFICLILLVGCSIQKKSVDKSEQNKEFVLEKINKSEDIVYFKEYMEVFLGDDIHQYKYPVINIKSEEVDNINLELKNYVTRCYKNAGIFEGVLNSGEIVEYKNYTTDKYISIIQSSYYYIDGMVGERSDKVYVISLESGKLVSKNKILDQFGISEEQLLKQIENNIDSDDIQYTMMNIKENGYYLYINDKDELCVIFYEVTDEEEIRKELVLN